MSVNYYEGHKNSNWCELFKLYLCSIGYKERFLLIWLPRLCHGSMIKQGRENDGLSD